MEQRVKKVDTSGHFWYAVEDVSDEVEETTPVATAMDRLEAQVTYTAMMTDTLLEV